MSLRLRLFCGIGVFVLFLFLIFSLSAVNQAVEMLEQKELETGQLLNDIIQTEMDAQVNVATVSALTLSNNRQVQQLFAQRDREGLLDLLLPSFRATNNNLAQLQFHLPDSTSFLRLHEPDRYGDSLADIRHTVNECNRTLTRVAGLEEGRSGYGFRVVVPMFWEGKHTGSLEVGTSFGATFLRHLANHVSGEYYVYRIPQVPSVVWEDFQKPGQLIATASLRADSWPLKHEILSRLARGETVFTQSEDNKHHLVLVPFFDYAGVVKGYYKVVMDRSLVTAGIFQMKKNLYTFSILGALVVGILVFIYLGRSLEPIKELVKAMQIVTTGDLNRQIKLKPRRDEIGQLTECFQLMVAKLREIVAALDDAREKQAGYLRDTVLALAAAVEARDVYTINHSQQVASIAKAIGTHMGMSRRQAEQLYFAGLLHDIGKIGIPDFILQKPGKLTELEFSEIQSHTEVGYKILEAAGDIFAPMAPMVKYHHEKWNGTGYPEGLRGEEIPLGAAILAVADAFDAMVSSRPYRNALTEEKALEEIVACSGSHFHPQVVDIFISHYKEIMKQSVAETTAGAIVNPAGPVGRQRQQYMPEMILRPFDYRVRYDGILQAVNDVVLVFSEEMKLIEWNHRAERLYGYTCEEFSRMSAGQLFSSVDSEELEKCMQAQKGIGVFRAKHRKKDGTVFPVEVTNVAFVEAGKKCWLNLVRELEPVLAGEDTA
ncbi:MAG: HD domain-containing protein [Clostridia bacterium]|jgi:PAS domain S-box-containing protein|nr:HD domain-containing protein [Clostridia bacterium]